MSKSSKVNYQLVGQVCACLCTYVITLFETSKHPVICSKKGKYINKYQALQLNVTPTSYFWRTWEGNANCVYESCNCIFFL